MAPAVEGGRSLEEVHSLLIDGRLGIATLHDTGAAAVIVLEPGIFDGLYCLWISYLAGEVKGPPKAWLRIVRRAMAQFETKARQAGIAEIRIGGRDWSRVFPDWLPCPAVPNGLRKVL